MKSDSSVFAQRRQRKKIIKEAKNALVAAAGVGHLISADASGEADRARKNLINLLSDSNATTSDIQAALGVLDRAINILADDVVNRLKAQLDPAVKQFRSWGKER